MVGPLLFGLAGVAGAGGDVGLDADDGLQPLRAGLPIEVDGGVEDAVVGEGDRLLSQLAGAIHELRDTGEAVEQAVLGVDVKVGEHVSPGFAPLIIAAVRAGGAAHLC